VFNAHLTVLTGVDFWFP